jgi:predicted nucleic acid-binding protein
MHASAKLTEAFNELLMSDHPIVVPNLVHYEVVNALWKYVRAGTIDAERCRRLLFAFLCLPLRLVDDDQLHLEASDMANHLLGLTGYDAHFIALARRAEAELWTNDRRLANLAGTLGIAVTLWPT